MDATQVRQELNVQCRAFELVDCLIGVCKEKVIRAIQIVSDYRQITSRQFSLLVPHFVIEGGNLLGSISAKQYANAKTANFSVEIQKRSSPLYVCILLYVRAFFCARHFVK